MDDYKRKLLKVALSTMREPWLIPVERFFDGNDDLGSIGCNLTEHPGVDVFRDVFAALLRRPDVEAIYAQISELDPGEGCWPFTDTVLVVGTISPEDVRRAVGVLEPDEVGSAAAVPLAIAEKHRSPVLAVWWD